MAIRRDKLTLKAQEALQQANQLASENGYPELLPLHLLTAMLKIRKALCLPCWRRLASGRRRFCPT